jgi:hypothetical protein
MVPRLAGGGMINGGSGTKDDIPAMLTGGEFVVNKKSVQKYGSEFLHAINSGKLGGYAKGGKVDEIPNQNGAGGFFASGLYDTGSIVGKENLLGFATQSYTSGARDVIASGNGAAYVNLEPESGRLTQFGRANDRMSQVTQSVKEQSFGLYVNQIEQEIDYQRQLKEYEEKKKAEKKALRNQLITMAITAAAGPILNAAQSGFQAGFSSLGSEAGFGAKLWEGIKGIGVGGEVGGVNVGGLSNLFTGVGKGLTGNFSEASNYFKLSQIGNIDQLSQAYAKGNPNFTGFLDKAGFEYAPRASIINESGIGINGGGGGAGIFGNAFNKIKGLFSFTSGQNEDIDENEFLSTGRDIYDGGLLPEWNPRTNSFGGDYGSVVDFTQEELDAFKADNIRRATGGIIPSTSGIDTVPAMLSGGEFIMNRAASQNIGAGNLQSLNAGASSLPTEEKTEELNDRLIAKLDELIEASGSGGSITINVEAATGKSFEQTSGDDNERRVQMARLIKDMVLKVIQDEKRLGGVLRRG